MKTTHPLLDGLHHGTFTKLPKPINGVAEFLFPREDGLVLHMSHRFGNSGNYQLALWPHSPVVPAALVFPHMRIGIYASKGEATAVAGYSVDALAVENRMHVVGTLAHRSDRDAVLASMVAEAAIWRQIKLGASKGKEREIMTQSAYLSLNNVPLMGGDESSIAVVYFNLSGRNFRAGDTLLESEHKAYADYLAFMEEHFEISLCGTLTLHSAEAGCKNICELSPIVMPAGRGLFKATTQL